MKSEMKLLEEYSELIERDSAEISFLWKGLQILAYFVSILTGYSCAILFYILWQDIFGGHCPFYAKLDLLSRSVNVEEYLYDDDTIIIQQNDTDWKHYIIVNYNYANYCKFYFAVCLLSCMFGIIWLMLFSMCGKGGYDIRINTLIEAHSNQYLYSFVAPWRIVIPALLFNFCLTIITLYATRNMEKGYQEFSKDLKLLFIKITGGHTTDLYAKECLILQDYVTLYTLDKLDVCNIFYTLETISWLMTWSWITGFMILLMRFITVNDFRLLKIQVFTSIQDQNEVQKEKEG